MSQTRGTGGDAEFLSDVGQALIDIAEEWQRSLAREDMNSHIQSAMRQVYGAMCLELGVRAAALRGRDEAKQQLEMSQQEFRSHLKGAISRM